MHVCELSPFSHVRLFATPWTVRLLCPWDFPSKNTGVGCHALLQGIFLAQGSNPSLLGLLHCRWILYHQANQGALRQTVTNNPHPRPPKKSRKTPGSKKPPFQNTVPVLPPGYITPPGQSLTVKWENNDDAVYLTGL